MTRTRTRFVAALLAGTAMGGLFTTLAPSLHAQAPAPLVAAAPQPGFAALVERVQPAVVGIQAQGQGQRGIGSGFIVDPAGLVVTNAHVVEGARELRVTLADGRELPARLLGADARTDLALLKLEAGAPLPHVPFGDSDAARVGDWVVAVGSPFGLSGTVTAGILSARGREIGAGPYDDFLQVDAPINRGNSGGPLFGLDGAVVGVNTAIFSPSGGSVGIGFSIPANLAKQVVAQLRDKGRVERGFLGVATQPLTPALAAALGMPAPQGALVADVTPDSPAARAGLRPGDVVLAVNGQALRDGRALARAMAAVAPGQEATLTIRRGGAEQALTARVAEGPEARVVPARADAPAEPRRGGALGLALAPHPGGGAVVAAVRPGSPAEAAGLQPGDAIEAVNGQPVAGPEAAAAALRALSGPAALAVRRDGRAVFVGITPPASPARG